MFYGLVVFESSDYRNNPQMKTLFMRKIRSFLQLGKNAPSSSLLSQKKKTGKKISILNNREIMVTNETASIQSLSRNYGHNKTSFQR